MQDNSIGAIPTPSKRQGAYSVMKKDVHYANSDPKVVMLPGK